jgi:serine/threonine protein kinase/Tol biopolymer transport system component
MELPAGTRLGPYEILSHIGAGAMGVVYKAQDTRLGRHVAIKVLPPVFARDPDRLSRFEREARAVAALNHPNIVSVHDIGSAEIQAGPETVRVTYLITELLDGETLRDRLAGGALPAKKSADIAMQAARGLTAAHDRGIIHRDLKPENIVLLGDGQVKILDFGLAKQSAANKHEQQTMTSTEAGTVLGTVGYMSPEQVRGAVADPRSDLFSLGAVLFELATGQRAFVRDTAAETMTAILKDDVPEAAIEALPPALARIIRHALEKEPNDRFQSARDFAFALRAYQDSTSSGPGSGAVIAATPPRSMSRRELVAWSIAGIAIAVTAAALFLTPAISGHSTALGAGSPTIFSPAVPYRDSELRSPSISPDGARVAFIAHDTSGDTIVVRRFDAIQTQALKGTAGVRQGSIFWSPNGESLAFSAGGRLKTIELASGKIEELADASASYGGAWGPDGTILFSPEERSPIYRLDVKTRKTAPVTTLDTGKGEEAHRWPHFMPDGRHFIYMPWRIDTVTRTIHLASLDGTAPRALFDSESAPVVAGNHFIYARDVPSRLLTLAFDPKTYELDGEPTPIVGDDNVDYWWATGDSQITASANTLIYMTGKYRPTRLTWFNRSGRALGFVGDADVYYDPAISRDGKMLAVEKRDPDNDATDLWTVDLARGAFSRLTSTRGFEDVSTWSPDGRRIAFAGDINNTSEPTLFIKAADGTSPEESLMKGRQFPMDWSRDGRYLLYKKDGGATRQDIWVYDFQTKQSRAVMHSPFDETGAHFSPNGKWIAYASDEGRDMQVYLRAFPDGGTKIQVSTAGGQMPEWRADGRELYYLAPDTTLMSVDIRENGNSVDVGTPQSLFVTNTDPPNVIRNTYASSPDGQRFIVMSPVVPLGTSRLVGVMNWAAGIKK